MKRNYIVIPVIVFLQMLFGARVCCAALEWYHTLNLPAITPPKWVFAPVWTMIFFFSAWFGLVVWNAFPRNRRFNAILALFLVSIVLNVAWSHLFFTYHEIGWALADAIALTATVYGMIALAAPVSYSVALLLVPYAAWGTFACYLNYLIWTLN